MKRIFTTLVLLAITATVFSQTSYYVNDGGTGDNIFCNAGVAGSDLNPGTAELPFATLTKAMTTAVAGDVIYIDPGTYPTTNFTINKSISILGPNYNITPLDVTRMEYNTSRNAEAFINGALITIGANDINIKGLVFDPGAKIQISKPNNGLSFSNITIAKNGFLITSNQGAINIFGNNASPASSTNYIIDDNVFVQQGSSIVQSVTLNALDNVLISNNSFLNDEGAPFTQTPIHLGANSLVSNITITDNLIDEPFTGIFSNLIGNITLANNKIYNSFTSTAVRDGTSTSGTITLKNNYYQINRSGSSLVVQLFGTSPAGTLKKVIVENNTIDINATGFPNSPTGYLYAQCNVGISAAEYVGRKNVINITGNLTGYNGLFFTMRCNGKFNSVNIDSNEVNFNATNLPATSNAYGIVLNLNTGSGNVPPPGSTISITQNKVSGFGRAVQFLGGTLPGVNCNINENSLTNNRDLAIVNGDQISPSMNATCNWYGFASAQSVAAKIFSSTPGAVNYTPWLINGTDNEPSTPGFQPVPGSCTGRQTAFFVNNNDLTGDVFTTAIGNNANNGLPSQPFATLEYALSLSQLIAGDTIFVDAGSYSPPDFTITKGITILGTNYFVSPNDAVDPLLPNAGRNTESIISNCNITIGAANINIKGLSFDPATKTQIMQTNTGNDFDNVTISKNIFRITSGATVINMTGKQVNPLVTMNYEISDNRFIKEVNNSGSSVSLAAVNGVLIEKNTFTVSNDAANRTQNGYLGGNFRSDNFVITNNVAYRQRNVFQNPNALKARIDFNKAVECERFALDFNGINKPCEIDISDNVVIDPKTTGGPVISYAKTFGTDISAPNIARIERNTITLNATGLTSIAQALIAPTIDNNSPNTQVYIRGNSMKISGDFSAQLNTGLYVSGIRFFNNSRQALVENNEIEFTGTNFGTINKFGIGVLHSGLLPDAIFTFTGNKISGFPTSIGIQQSTAGNPFGNLPTGLTMDINNNSFTGDQMSINNGTSSQSVNASCNWYGSAAAQDFINKLTIPTVDLVPWLTDGTDMDPSIGFQPVAGACDNGYPTLITLDSYTDVTCNGANNGTINITTTYGRTPFTYTWTKDGDSEFISHDEDLANLSPGTYHLALVDGNGSNIYITDPEADGPGTIDVTITEPSVLSATASGTNVSCFNGSDGTATVIPAGGTEPYTYLWNNGQTTQSISNLVAGTYSVTITDDNGCTITAQYIVTQPTLLTAVATGTSTSCSNSATVVASGGTAPYSYSWSNEATTQSITSLPAGTYSVTVTDAKGCTTSASCTVTASEAFNPSASVINVSCFGGNNGSITVTNVNATAPFQYSMNGINFQNSNVFSNLTAGAYTITVKDANGCTGFVSKTIAQPTQLLATLNSVQSTCYGSATGAINISVSGGTTAYSYQWTGPNGYSSTQLNISSLAAGDYFFTVTDNKGCQANLNVAVPNYNVINVTGTRTNVICKGDANGTIDLTVSGGTNSGFSYLWNDLVTTTQDRVNLAPGNYQVTITDIGSGCTVIRKDTITQPDNLLKLQNPVISSVKGCAAADLGSILASATGGITPYQFKLGNGAYQLSSEFTGLNAGFYRVWVKDLNGCEKYLDVEVTDNGNDQYETCIAGKNNNNNKNNSCTISTGTTISARIGKAGDADWFKFTIGSAGNYTVSFVHPSPVIRFAVSAGTGSPAPALVGSTATSRTYTFGSGTYYVNVFGATSTDFSLTCYQLSVTTTAPLKSSGSKPQNEIAAMAGEESFNIKAFPNPSGSYFNLKVETGRNEKMSLRVVDITGRVIEERLNLQPQQIIRLGDRYLNGVYIAEIIQGGKRKAIRLVKM